MIILFELEIAKLLGIIPPSTKKRKQPLEEAGEFLMNVASAATTAGLLCYVGSWLLSGKKK
jgi:hypothetical protein